MKVSIITAVRNGAGAIQSTIESVNAQSYGNVEHVFVDGASTDNTVELIESLSGRPRKVISERDSGVYQAFAKGYGLSTGDVIAYLNAGDVYSDSGVIARMVAQLESTGVDAAFGDLVIVDQHDLRRVTRRYRSARFSPSMVSYGFMPAHPTLFVRRSAYDRFGTYDETYRIAGDFELVVRMFVRGRISYAFVDEVLVRMVRGGLSTSGIRSNWIITKEMKRACETNGVATNYVKLALRFPMKITELWQRR